MFAFMELDSVHWLICGLLVLGCVVTVVIVLVRRRGRSIEDPGVQRKMCPFCGELIQEDASKCEYCRGLIDKPRRSGK